MEIVYGGNANLDTGVAPKVRTFVIEAALLVQSTACLLLLLVALQHGNDFVFMEIDSDRRFSAADFVGVKEPLPENEDTGEKASQDPEDNGDGEGDDDDEGEDESDDDVEGSDDDYSEADSDEESDDEEDEDEDEDEDDDEEDEDEDEDDEDEDDEDDDKEEDDAQSQPPSKRKK